VDLSHQGEDIPEVTGLEARVLHHLQQQVRRGLGLMSFNVIDV
jgi:hypothetical protein